MQFCYTFSTVFMQIAFLLVKYTNFKGPLATSILFSTLWYSAELVVNTYYLVCICATGKHLLTTQDFNILH